MTPRIPLAWLQLRRDRLRLLAASAGVAFAVALVFVQLGFQDAMFESAVGYHTSLDYDLAIVSPKTEFIVRPHSFPRVRLFQAKGLPGVESVTAVYMQNLARWRNPVQPELKRAIYVVGFDPSDAGFDIPGLKPQLDEIRKPDRVLFDALSRPEFGPVPELLRKHGRLRAEVNNRDVEVVGLFELGTSFGIDGSLLTSDLNFLRMFPNRSASHIDLGLVHLAPGVAPEAVRTAIAELIPNDVEVFTRAGFIQRELDYWSRGTPIGYVFGLGVVIGLVVGMIVVYQILFSDVQDHLREYATLKAIGYTHGYLVGVVLQEAAILALCGFVPGLLVALFVYAQAGGATQLPVEMTWVRAISVLGLTLGMCGISGVLALRKLRAADPAEVF